MSFQYPNNWILKTKQGTFDMNTTYLVAVYDPSVNLTDDFPSFGLQGCTDIDVLNMMIKVVKSTPYYGDKLPFTNVTDVKSLALMGEATTGYLSTLMGAVSSLINSFGNSTFEAPQIATVQHTTVKPKFIDGEDTGVFTILSNLKIDNATKSLNVGTREYAVIHDGIAYPFLFSADPSKFDNLESPKIRERILNSIRFTNDTNP